MAEEIKMKCMVGGKLSVVSLSTARYSPYPLRATKVSLVCSSLLRNSPL